MRARHFHVGTLPLSFLSSLPSHPHRALIRTAIINMADSRSAEGHEASTQESQNALSTSVGESASTSSASLEGFWLLPEETKLWILTLACSSPDAKGTSPDVATGRNLALTARCFLHLANACLWSAIRITRISVLTSLAKAIAARPELGRRIKSLHAGPDDELDQLHYPYRQEGEGRNIQGRYHAPASFISTSLRSAEETKLLPSWCSPGQEWPLTPYVDEAPIFRCERVKAVAQAVQSAQRGLGIRGGQVHLVEEDYLLQTALDLYLMNMRRIEDASEIALGEDQRCQAESRPHYAPLLITGTRSQPDVPMQASAPGHFVLTRKQLLDHLARPGCPSDRFDHPLLLTRVGFWASLIQEWTKGYNRWQPNNRYEPGREYDGYQYGGTEVVTSFSRPDVELMRLLRSIIERAPSLRNLSLTGLFEGAIGGERGPSPKALRTLSLGPPPRIRHWSHVSLELGGLEEIEALHLCGVIPRQGDIPKLATLRRLKTLRWTHTDAFVAQEIIL